MVLNLARSLTTAGVGIHSVQDICGQQQGYVGEIYFHIPSRSVTSKLVLSNTKPSRVITLTQQ